MLAEPVGVCHFNPPSGDQPWPITKSDDWCREWRSDKVNPPDIHWG